MIELQGTSVYGGVVEGEIFYVKQKDDNVKRKSITNVEAEVERLQQARSTAILQLDELYNKALPEVGEQGAALFQIHQMMLEDEDFTSAIENMIKTQMVNAEYAVAVTEDDFAGMFSQMDDPYMKERAADVHDISSRLISCLKGEVDKGITSDRPVIVAAEDLSPSETIQMDKSKILSFITAGGSTNSHTAILSRTMGIPAIVGLGDQLKEEYNGNHAIIDGFTGKIYINPDEETAEKLRKKEADWKHQKTLLMEMKGKENISKDGVTVDIYANIGEPDEVSMVLENDAGGIGLFRSEFIYMGTTDYPTEEEQFSAYKTVAQKMGGKRVIFRTMDIGADKQIDYFNLNEEENPALGLRGIRISLERPHLFKTQLRALLRASAFGKVAIMFPMVSSLWEIQEAKRILNECKKELKELGVRYGEIEVGIMIETPAAALISDILAPEVDFFSVGTNDLTQYTLAVDRQNNSIARYTDEHHPAVLRLIKLAADNAHANDKWIGICGELAGDLRLTKTFLQMGIDELSVSPTKVLELRKQVRETTVND